jgi:hypothetical protein
LPERSPRRSDPTFPSSPSLRHYGLAIAAFLPSVWVGSFLPIRHGGCLLTLNRVRTSYVKEANQNNMDISAWSFDRWLCCSLVTDRCGYAPRSSQNRHDLPDFAGCLASGQNPSAQIVHVILISLLSLIPIPPSAGFRRGAVPKRSCWRGFCLALLALALAHPVFDCRSEDLGGQLQDFTLRTWTKADGLPDSSVTVIQQTQDGYLWVAEARVLPSHLSKGIPYRLSKTGPKGIRIARCLPSWKSHPM